MRPQLIGLLALLVIAGSGLYIRYQMVSVRLHRPNNSLSNIKQLATSVMLYVADAEKKGQAYRAAQKKKAKS